MDTHITGGPGRPRRLDLFLNMLSAAEERIRRDLPKRCADGERDGVALRHWKPRDTRGDPSWTPTRGV
jgi:hypothetical protein